MKYTAIKLAIMHMLAIILFLFGNISVSAQYYMNVFPKNGQKIRYMVADLDSINFSDQSESAEDYEYVDLGLSVNWATHNVGSGKFVEDYGDYYAWGETETKNEYSWDTYKYSNSAGYVTKYCTDKNWGYDGLIDNKKVLDLIDDVAHLKGGNRWRLPTIEEYQELLNNCSWSLTYKNGIKGYVVKSKINGFTDRSIFFPAAGFKKADSLIVGVGGYISSTLGINNCASLMAFNDDVPQYVINWPRYVGYSVRPVFQSESWKKNLSLFFNKDVIDIGSFGIDTLCAILQKGNEDISMFNLSDGIEWSSDNPSVACVDQNGIVIGLEEGSTYIKATLGDLTTMCAVNVVNNNPNENGYEYVDLGLSVKWASHNIGAANYLESGNAYRWGETIYDPSYEYNWTSYKYFDADNWGEYNYSYTKYCDNSVYGKDGFTDDKTVLDLEDDVAHVDWGSIWRMPTEAEIEELKNNCKWKWITINGVGGYIVTSNVKGFEDKTIFFVADGSLVNNIGTYWSSSLSTRSSTMAACLSFSSYSTDYYTNLDRVDMLAVRPVFVNDVWYDNVSLVGLNKSQIAIIVESETYNLKGRFSKDNKDVSDLFDSNILQWSSNDSSIVIVDKNGIVKGVSEGVATITGSYKGISRSCSITVLPQPTINNTESGHGFVDLGLSVKWATSNVGAENWWNYGDFFAWGETETHYEQNSGQHGTPIWKDGYYGYGYEDYKYCDGYSYTLKKYCNNSKYGYNGFTDDKTILEPEDDVAHIKWGGSWRMPTEAEIEELLSNCTLTQSIQNGVKGCMVTSNVEGYRDRSIFLPSAGYYTSDDHRFAGSEGYYWSSSLYTDEARYSYYLVVTYEGWHGWGAGGGTTRNDGMPIRPVCP